MHVMCTKPPRCVLFRPLRSRASNFEGLEDGIVPIFPIERSITIKNNSIRRKQVPMCAAFCVTDYKAQGQTFSEVDLKHDSKANGRDSHRIFCSINVQLSRFTSLQRLYLLERIQASDIDFKPHPDLLAEMSRLQALESQTMTRWCVSDDR